MYMAKQPRHTKQIIIIGYILIASFAIIGIVSIYKELIKFSEISDTTNERKELVIIGNTLVSLYKLEGTTSWVAASNIEHIKAKYDSLLNDVFIHIDTLRKFSPDNLLENHLDSMEALLSLKKQNTMSMLQLVDSVEKKVVRETTKTTVLSKKDISDINKLLVNTSKNVEDTTVIKPTGEKKNWFQRAWAAAKNQPTDSSIMISKYQSQVLDSIIVPTMVDTLTQYVNDLVLDYDKKNNAIMHHLVIRQHSMNRTNDRLTYQINQIMRDIEQREYSTSINLLREKEITLKRSSRIVSIIGLSALTSTLLFLFFSLRSITKTQRYRKEIESAKKFAEDLLAARERLLLTITHDIKAPLSSIIGYIELLYKSKLPEKEKYYLENMQHSSEHVLQLVKNLLDYHLLETDKQIIQTMPFFPCILLNDIYLSFLPLANKAQLTLQFECNIKDKNINYSSDPYRIRQIVNNLTSNAIKFTPSGGTIVISASIIKNIENNTLIISVKDNGLGIDEEDKKIIFQEFIRLKSSTSFVEGSGLGLPIAKKLVKLLNGTIDVISEKGEGSEFIAKIPITITKESKTLKPQKDDLLEFNVDTNKKILFIDDDRVQLNLFSELLKFEGFTPTICDNSMEALALLQTTPFDMVFTDIQMPEMNGFELVERIRMGIFAGSKSMPVIALSGSSDMAEPEFIEAGFSGFLSKPFKSNQLLNIIQKFLGKGNKNIETPIQNLSEAEVKGFSALSNFAGDDIQAGAEIIQSFIDENKQNEKALKKAFAKKDLDEIKKICHKMLPLMRMISAGDIVYVLCDLERGFYDKGKEKLLIKLLENQIKEAESFLESLNH